MKALDMTWMQDAACVGIDTEIFFPPSGSTGGAALRICGRCPVREQCADYADTNHERFGIWGGLSIEERYRRHRRKAAA